MPLLFYSKNYNDRTGWLSLQFSSATNEFYWKADRHPVGHDATTALISSADYAAHLDRKYFAFNYRDTALLDDNENLSVSAFLNARGDRPDFSAAMSETGWLSPEGIFTGCDEGNHGKLIFLTLGVSRERAGTEGWINVQPDYWQNISGYLLPNELQKPVIRKLGFNLAGRRMRVPPFESLAGHTLVPETTADIKAVLLRDPFRPIKDRIDAFRHTSHLTDISP